jgi:uncharacterized membrane protein YqjE
MTSSSGNTRSRSGSSPGSNAPRHAFARIAGSIAALAHTRLELFGIELAEEKDRLLSLLLLSLFAVMIGLLTLMCVTALIVLALWNTYRWQPLAILTALYVLITLFCTWRVIAKLNGAPAAFETTRAEFENDRALVEQWRQSRDHDH